MIGPSRTFNWFNLNQRVALAVCFKFLARLKLPLDHDAATTMLPCGMEVVGLSHDDDLDEQKVQLLRSYGFCRTSISIEELPSLVRVFLAPLYIPPDSLRDFWVA